MYTLPETDFLSTAIHKNNSLFSRQAPEVRALAPLPSGAVWTGERNLGFA